MKKNLLLLCLFPLTFLHAQEFPIATGNYSQSYPSAAFANDMYFNVFLDKSTGSSAYGFHGKFVAPDGTVQGGEPEVVPPISSLSFMHEIIWGETNYIFAWSRGRTSGWTRDAYIQMVNTDGSPQGAMQRVSIGNSESASFVEVAFDGENFLVVWQEGMPNNGSMINAQFVSQEGQLVGSNFSIRPESLAASVDQIYPDVEFDGEKYLVVWDDNRNGNRDIFGQFVDTDGNFAGDDFAICTHTADQLLVQLACGGDNFYAVWGDERLSSNDKGIFGQLIGLDGTLIGDNLSISPPANSEGRTWPDVAASNNEYLVVWDQEWLEYKTQHDSRGDLESLKYEAAGVSQPKPTVWYDIYARKITFSGEYGSDEMAVCTADFHQQDCDVASDGSDFLVSWSDSRNNNQYYDIYGYIVEGSAVPLMPELFPDEIEFISLHQILEGGEEFAVINPNDFEIAIDSIWFVEDVNRVWYIPGEPPQFPVIIPANDQVQFTVNLLLPGGKHSPRSFATDTLIVESMGGQKDLLLKIDEAVIDSIYTSKLDFTIDSVFFQTAGQAILGDTIGLINRHLPQIYIADVYTTGNPWMIEPEYPLPFAIFYEDTLNFHLYYTVPIKPSFSDEILMDTLWFQSYESLKYWFPIYYYAEIIDTLWLSAPEPANKSQVNMHPNPASDKVYITSGEDFSSVEAIEITDLNGNILKKLRAEEFLHTAGGIMIELQLPAGVYFIRISFPDEVTIRKLLIH
ncbi:MAG: T9SS type A sorting domain-containing protein [Bacteroidales bacterium]